MPYYDPVQPDYLVVLKANAAIIHDRRIRGVSDLIVEVLSPGDAAYHERVKLLAYGNAGVPEYAIIDPSGRTLSLYQRDQRGRWMLPRVAGEHETIAFACLSTLSFTVADLFAGAPDTTL
jgi:Uma2 family endonuclease